MSKKDSDRIGKYLEQQNRPYSINDIFMNLHKEIGKTALQKAMDLIVSEGSVREKVYGKQKVYVYNQEQFPALDQEELKKMDTQINDLTTSLHQAEKEALEMDSRLRALNSSLTTEEVNKKIAELEEEIPKLQKKLKNLEENQVLVSKEEREATTKQMKQMVVQWRKRRRCANDMLDGIMEGYPHSKKKLIKEIGLETDEEVGAVMPVI
ncbi:hypothetical protein Pmani_028080 [Petrolisthes manimaculis]|uniref:Homologous-pairing protein 2 homolog n=1 Tax=Petrolisthes manimaculis TaxID=1843537 RepID=A0AAE1TV62_9EUCA|nr:hypothetical protein Pmani_028080 [Petrolisthes manimaculis]